MTSLVIRACLAAVISLGAGCREKREAHSAKPHATGYYEERAARLNATVWRDEVLARQHERTFWKLADDIRRAEDKLGVLAELGFAKISIPSLKNGPAPLSLGIHHQSFDEANVLILTQDQWRTALSQYKNAGGSITQTEWHHEMFSPPEGGTGASSDFRFEIHGEQAAQTNRFILSGVARVKWATKEATNALPQPTEIIVRELSLLERAGPPGFNNHLVVAPEPERAGGQVNLHPVIVTDINGDGHDDIALPSVNKVLLNDGRAQFDTAPLIQANHFYALQNVGLMADFNGDGNLDFIGVAEMGPLAKMLVLYPGNGQLPFAAEPAAAWSAQQTSFAAYKFTAASVLTAGDVDQDGDLDVFVAQYRPPYTGGQLPTPYYDANDGYSSYLLRNDGRGRFTLDSAQPALREKQRRRTLSASLADLDGDGDLDLATLNDYSGLDLYYNDGQGNFTDETARLAEHHLFGMGLSLADFDQDGQLDIFATGMSIPTVARLEGRQLTPPDFPERTRKRAAMGYGNRLYTLSAGKWLEPKWAAQLARTGWSWGVAALDADNNGTLDCYIANGHVSGASIADYDSQCWTHDIYLGTSREDPLLQRYLDAGLKDLNTGKTSWAGYLHNAFFLEVGRYVNVSFLMGLAHESDCRAVVSADLNEDGRQDLLVTEARWMGSPNRMQHRLLVHLNQLSTENHWLGVRLSAKTSSPIGAHVSLRAGGRTYVGQIVTGDSFQAQQPNTVHFGIGASTQVDELNVRWPDGQTNQLRHPQIDRYHLISHQ